MTVTVKTFRGAFTEFADPARFPDAMLSYWLDIASKLVNTDRWGNLSDNGVSMFAAHNATLERRAMDEADLGGIPGMSTGIVNNKSVDKVSVGYDTQGGVELDAGHWNLTIYGTRYIRLARQMGMGPVQVGIGCGGGPGAWSGPWTGNFPNFNQ